MRNPVPTMITAPSPRGRTADSRAGIIGVRVRASATPPMVCDTAGSTKRLECSRGERGRAPRPGFGPSVSM